MRAPRIVRFALVTGLIAAAARADVRMPRIFSPGVVLQRDTHVQVFGFAAPGEEVRVRASFGASSDVALADQDGRWSTWIATPGAGGPHTLEVAGKNVVKIDDVWVGEVWLASGQSNMEEPVGPAEGWRGAVDWEQEIARESDPKLRLFTVENALSPVASDDVKGSWTAAAPADVARFSAVAYFFARRLRAELDVPVGIVVSDWGGTPIEAWTSGITLARDNDFRETIAGLERDARSPGKSARTESLAEAAWLGAVEEVDHGLRDGFVSAAYDDAAWTKVAVPGALPGDFARHDGIFWLRRAFEVPAAAADRDAVLELPPVDDFDTTFVDGVRVGATLARGKGRDPRHYTIPRALMTPGRHVLAVRVLDVGGPAGIESGPSVPLISAGGPMLPLAGEWRARAGAKAGVIPPRPPRNELGPNTPSVLYNAMIAPLERFAFRGVIWYQGESNRARAAQYDRLFRAFIQDWRARFGRAEMPFYFAQIAPFDYQGDKGEAAELREAQRRALRLPATGLVSTSDLGDAGDIHPRKKREVGERFALHALAGAYGRALESSGPIVDDAHSGPGDSGELVLRFDHAQGLRFTGDARGVLEVTDGKTPWVRAGARIDGASVILTAAECPRPTSARLSPRADAKSLLVNAAGLPAAEFRIGPAPWLTERKTRGGRWARVGDFLTLSPPTASAVEGLPIGNGLLGALVWVDGASLKLLVGRSDWWDLRRPAITRDPSWNWRDMQALVASGDEAKLHERYDDPYERFAYPTRLAAAEIEIPLGTRQPVAFSLDVARGEAQVPLTNGLVRACASAARPILALRIEDADLERLTPDEWRVTTAGGKAWKAEDGWRAEIVAADGSALALAVSAVRRDSGVELVIALVSGAEDAAPLTVATTRAQQALGAGYSWLLGEHISAYRTAIGAGQVTLGDAALQDHYDFVRYLTLAASRRGAPPAALQGPWTVDLGSPPWHGDYHNDLNLQTTYGAYLTAGLMDSGLALFEFHARLLPRFREFARDFYGVPGAIVPGVMALDGSPLGGWAQYALSPTNSAWTADLFARHWRVTRDERFLEATAEPFCREIATALDALAPPGADGKRRLPLSSSPEIHDNSKRAWLAPNSNYDLALLRAAFANAAELERETGRDADAQRFERALGELPAFALDPQGGLAIAPGESLAESHRHLSHALAIHPLGQLTIEGDERERAIVDATVDGIVAQGTRGWTGYTFAWFAALCARTGRPELARRYLSDYERAFTLRNGLHVNGDQSGEGLSGFTYRPFTLEGNMLAMEAVHEMLLQSWGGTVRVFPAVSAAWPDVAFEELRAEGAFVVSARRSDGVTRSVTVRALVNGHLRLRDPFGGREPQWTLSGVVRDGRDFTLDMARDEVLIGTCAVR